MGNTSRSTGLKAEVGPSPNALGAVRFRWDSETEILTGSVGELAAGTSSCCTVELEDGGGAVVSLDVADGVLCGVEIVVWPVSEVVPQIRAPEAAVRGRVFLSAAVDDPIVEVDTSLACELAPDESVIHVKIGGAKPAQSIAIAKNLLVDLDGGGSVAGMWLLNVPPFAPPET